MARTHASYPHGRIFPALLVLRRADSLAPPGCPASRRPALRPPAAWTCGGALHAGRAALSDAYFPLNRRRANPSAATARAAAGGARVAGSVARGGGFEGRARTSHGRGGAWSGARGRRRLRSRGVVERAGPAGWGISRCRATKCPCRELSRGNHGAHNTRYYRIRSCPNVQDEENKDVARLCEKATQVV